MASREQEGDVRSPNPVHPLPLRLTGLPRVGQPAV
jgi:hypothetical protein